MKQLVAVRKFVNIFLLGHRLRSLDKFPEARFVLIQPMTYDMNEDVLVCSFHSNESVAFRSVEPFHRTVHSVGYNDIQNPSLIVMRVKQKCTDRSIEGVRRGWGARGSCPLPEILRTKF